MDLANLEKKLIEAARQNPPGDHVPFAFEKRVMAFVRSKPAMDELALWSRALWRAAGACMAIMLLLGAFTFFESGSSASKSQGDLSQAFENTLLAGVNQDADVSR